MQPNQSIPQDQQLLQDNRQLISAFIASCVKQNDQYINNAVKKTYNDNS